MATRATFLMANCNEETSQWYKSTMESAAYIKESFTNRIHSLSGGVSNEATQPCVSNETTQHWYQTILSGGVSNEDTQPWYKQILNAIPKFPSQLEDTAKATNANPEPSVSSDVSSNFCDAIPKSPSQLEDTAKATSANPEPSVSSDVSSNFCNAIPKSPSQLEDTAKATNANPEPSVSSDVSSNFCDPLANIPIIVLNFMSGRNGGNGSEISPHERDFSTVIPSDYRTDISKKFNSTANALGDSMSSLINEFPTALSDEFNRVFDHSNLSPKIDSKFQLVSDNIYVKKIQNKLNSLFGRGQSDSNH
eukprot:CAMPEP_0113316420 /NCGR_PEP_ID=MMETSP0010_2-20120614/11704_1 /TAXON_ID=216773 ORGANISM="Corethron hystrix, Strain 308" /NCGR_SAMPLE_ID=MMETSP0010_2 /ASSEMBLY_ACC=CAM_ASM_000155 /LENGTH=306 /DNA_ID=CAMNT_0000173135 /DNA_START=233 /DNA_END=1153 /DNA_ORIENTATION=- /assembly_acc=CAM_ASM_000155